MLQFCNVEKKHEGLIVPLAREFARAAEAISKTEQIMIGSLQMQKEAGEKFQCSQIGVTKVIG
jgi:hypothetical protein